jgi:integrase
VLDSEPYRLFINSLRSAESRKAYPVYLKKYMQLQGIEDLLSEKNPRLVEHQIIDFVIKMKEKGKGYASLHNYVTTVLSFYRINDIVLNQSKISKFMPEQIRVRRDRGYTHGEISKLLEIADERIRVVILLLASTGIRIGAIPDLRLRNLEKKGDVYYKITIYENFKQEYFTYCSHECAHAIDSYLDFRKRYGEKLEPNSFVIREQFDVRNQFAIGSPIKTKPRSLAFKLMDLAYRAGIRQKEHLLKGQSCSDGASLRKEVAIAHGFRKFFTTQCINSKINSEIREMLLGHKIGLASCYYRPSEDEMLSEYEKAIELLTIDGENRLKKRVETLEIEKSKMEVIALKLQKLEEEFNKRWSYKFIQSLLIVIPIVLPLVVTLHLYF